MVKAKSKCPKCGEELETDCEACIESETSFHICKGKKEGDVVKVKWEIIER